MTESTLESDHIKAIDLQLTSGNQEARVWHLDGKGSTTWTPSYIVKVVGIYATLQEVPDASATTYTVKVTDGTNDITGTITFTEATDAAGTLKSTTIDDTYYEVATDATFTITTAGTTTTAGEIWLTLILERQ